MYLYLKKLGEIIYFLCFFARSIFMNTPIKEQGNTRTRNAIADTIFAPKIKKEIEA